VIVTCGDGSYMFGNPVPYHYVARAEGLPTLTVVANNQPWLAVRQSTLDVFPDGHAAKANVMALTELKPSPDYEKVVETCGGRGEKVEGPSELIPALERSLEAVRAGDAGHAQCADPGAAIDLGLRREFSSRQASLEFPLCGGLEGGVGCRVPASRRVARTGRHKRCRRLRTVRSPPKSKTPLLSGA
jgi:hypothetical protein